MPSLEWMSTFIKTWSDRGSLHDCLLEANKSLKSSKDFSRYRIINIKGEPTILSVAVEGGSRQLRSFDKIPSLKLSEHGDWRKNHLGTLDALLGRLPYFRDIEGAFTKVYLDKELNGLENFNMAIFSVIKAFLLENITSADIKRFYCDNTLMTRGKEIASELGREMSVVQAMAMKGKEALLGILAI